jgi:hypothetical protein
MSVSSKSAKQLRGLDEHVTCDVCGRTMLKGERPEAYLAPSRERKLVCQLCAQRAQKEGWIRESADRDMPVQPPRPTERRGLFRRRRGSAGAASAQDTAPSEPAPVVEPERNATNSGGRGRPPASGERRRMPRDPRHVTAVPTSVQLKIERALELFNESEHPRTVAGLARTLGPPQVSACTSSVSAAKVLLTVGWELSWYQFAVDLTDSDRPVRLEGRGHELTELPAKVRHWNAALDESGRITIGTGEDSGGEEPDHDL